MTANSVRTDGHDARNNEHRTVFVIAQRISTVRDADLILVLDEGEIGAKGTHEELLRDSELYNEILDSQMLLEPVAAGEIQSGEDEPSPDGRTR